MDEKNLKDLDVDITLRAIAVKLATPIVASRNDLNIISESEAIFLFLKGLKHFTIPGYGDNPDRVIVKKYDSIGKVVDQ